MLRKTFIYVKSKVLTRIFIRFAKKVKYMKQLLFLSVFVVFVLAAVVWNFLVLYEHQSSSPVQKIPLILQWNNLTWYDIFNNKFNENLKCSKECFFTNQKKYERKATVIFYHFGEQVISDIPKTINSKRLNVMVNFEPPTLGPFFLNFAQDFFNYTVTYRLDSDISMPYDCLRKSEINDTDKWSDLEVTNAIEMKKDTALYLVSHCNTDSKREVIVEKIKKHMNITQYGKCNYAQCERDKQCEYEAIRTHHFVLAFENSVCLDYVTEKLFRFRQLIVPIILDRKILRGKHKALNPYVIAVSDFKTIKDLVDYLQMLMKNKDEYRKYFDWTKLYVKTNKYCDPMKGIACKLCDAAWKVKNGYRKIIPDIRSWHENQICTPDFGNFIF